MSGEALSPTRPGAGALASGARRKSEELAAGGTRRSPPGMASAGRFAVWQIWLKRWARRPVSRAGGSSVRIGAVQAERAVRRLVQELGVDECAEQGVT